MFCPVHFIQKISFGSYLHLVEPHCLYDIRQLPHFGALCMWGGGGGTKMDGRCQATN